ncbi:MAG: putative toxin-antitoxin system toxin component, PIN family [Elusimicrobia bacterium HGW-Elusimicrobia-2]|nr:MAG: putative toxin-antitoxin system toxin component, PIN family [Elusimicrobia bacterium HGW-Elusimicrobia-2]
MKVVIDTNVLISGIFWRGVPNKILNSWVKGDFEIIVNQRMLNEYLRIIRNIDKDDSISEHWITFIAENSTIVPDKKIYHICVDRDDNKFLDCAVIGCAKYIVSGDKHLLALKNIMAIPIIKAAEFCKILYERM